MGTTTKEHTWFRQGVSPEVRFAHYSQPEGDCLIWTGNTSQGGYGKFALNSRYVLAHRYAYEQENGSIPKGLVLDHLCRNRACVKPEHLEAVSQKTNICRGNTGFRNGRRRIS